MSCRTGLVAAGVLMTTASENEDSAAGVDRGSAVAMVTEDIRGTTLPTPKTLTRPSSNVMSLDLRRRALLTYNPDLGDLLFRSVLLFAAGPNTGGYVAMRQMLLRVSYRLGSVRCAPAGHAR